MKDNEVYEAVISNNLVEKIKLYGKYAVVGAGVIALMPLVIAGSITILVGYAAYKIIDRYIPLTTNQVNHGYSSFVYS